MWWSFSRNFLACEVRVVVSGAEGIATSANLHTAKCVFAAHWKKMKILLSNKPSWRKYEKMITCIISPWILKSQLWVLQTGDFGSCLLLYKTWKSKSFAYSRNSFYSLSCFACSPPSPASPPTPSPCLEKHTHTHTHTHMESKAQQFKRERMENYLQRVRLNICLARLASHRGVANG